MTKLELTWLLQEALNAAEKEATSRPLSAFSP